VRDWRETNGLVYLSLSPREIPITPRAHRANRPSTPPAAFRPRRNEFIYMRSHVHTRVPSLRKFFFSLSLSLVADDDDDVVRSRTARIIIITFRRRPSTPDDCVARYYYYSLLSSSSSRVVRTCTNWADYIARRPRRRLIKTIFFLVLHDHYQPSVPPPILENNTVIICDVVSTYNPPSFIVHRVYGFPYINSMPTVYIYLRTRTSQIYTYTYK